MSLIGFPHSFWSSACSARGGSERAGDGEISEALEAIEVVVFARERPVSGCGGRGTESMRTWARWKASRRYTLSSELSVGTEENGVGERVLNALWRAAMIVRAWKDMLVIGYQCSKAVNIKYG